MPPEGREVSLFEAPIGRSAWRRLLLAGSLIFLSLCVTRPALGSEHPGSGIVDLSLMVAPNLPATWPDPKIPNFQISHYLKIGPEGAYNSDILTIDGNTGTQLDVPPHSVARPELGFPNSGPYGHMFIDRVSPWQLGGEACVVDLRSLRDAAPKGRSALIERKHIEAWERDHRPLRPGDVVLFYSGYSDHYYKPFPKGRRFIAAAIGGDTPGWPDPSPDCMEYLASRGVRALGTDSPSMGPLPDLAEPTHYAGLKHGMIWTEGVIGLGNLPSTGAFYCMLGPKHAGAPFGEGRAFAIVENPLAARLIDSMRKMRVVDLSVTLAPELPVTWPGAATGEHPPSLSPAGFLVHTAPRSPQPHPHAGQPRRDPSGAALVCAASPGIRRLQLSAPGSRMARRVRAGVRNSSHQPSHHRTGPPVPDHGPGPSHRRPASRGLGAFGSLARFPGNHRRGHTQI